MDFQKLFGQNLINVWSLIRPCWVDFFPKINTRVDTAIWAARVSFCSFWWFAEKILPLDAAEKKFENTNFQGRLNLCTLSNLLGLSLTKTTWLQWDCTRHVFLQVYTQQFWDLPQSIILKKLFENIILQTKSV